MWALRSVNGFILKSTSVHQRPSYILSKVYSAAGASSSLVGASSAAALRAARFGLASAASSACSAAAFSSAFSILRSSRPSAIAAQQAPRITSTESFASSFAGIT